MATRKDTSIRVSPATEAELETLVKVQFAAFGAFEPEQLSAGADTPENRASMVERHAQHMRDNSGLELAKAETTSDTKVSETKIIVGYCMLYFPNKDAATQEDKTPTPLRPLSTRPPRAEWLDHDAERLRKWQAMATFGSEEIQTHVAGRSCAYVRYMSVDPAHQRQGVGKALMSWACERFDSERVDAYLEASGAGEGLYSQFGFRRIGYSTTTIEGMVVEYSHMWRDAR